MKIMFVMPPSKSIIKSTLGTSGLPLGLAYMAAVTEREGHKTKLIDALALDYTMADVGREVKKFNPDIVGITATTSTIYNAYDVAKTVKEINSECTTVIGGPHVTFMAKETLKECPQMDIVVRGEGEGTIKEIVKAAEKKSSLKKVKGITFRNNNRITETDDRPFIQNVDDIPFPAYHLLPMEKYRSPVGRFGMVMTSRGCPFSCNFCSSSRLCGKVWRARSPGNIIKELRLLKEEYGITEIEFMDDTFTLDNKRAGDIADLIVKNKLDISWTCSSRVDTLTQKLAYKLKNAGCHTLYLGIESGSQKILNIIGKGITLEKSTRAVNITKRVKLNTLGSFILGIPGDTRETIEKTIRFARKLGTTFAQFTILTPYPGTKFFEEADKKGLILTKDWSKYTTLDPVLKIPGIPAKYLKRFLRKAYLNFYLRPKFIMEQIRYKNFHILKHALSVGIKYMKSS